MNNKTQLLIDEYTASCDEPALKKFESGIKALIKKLSNEKPLDYLFWAGYVDKWFVFYEKLKGVKPIFGYGAEQSALKGLVKQIEETCRNNKIEYTEDIAMRCFDKLLNLAARDQFHARKLSLRYLNANYMEIIALSSNKTQQSKTSTGFSGNYDNL